MIKYFNLVTKAMQTVDPGCYQAAQDMLEAESEDLTVLFGNGGSAAICNHIVCDITKGIYEDTLFSSRAVSLCTNTPLITAIANDYGYEQIFAKQLDYLACPDVTVVAVSSSGNSKNVCLGLIKAKEFGYNTIALVGFDGGMIKSDNMADTIVHVDSDNYGVVEDCHMMILHSFVQTIRSKYAKDPESLRL